MKMLKIFFLGIAFALGSAATADNPVRLKNFREIYASLVTVTGVDGRDAELTELFRVNVDRLPKVGEAGELSSNVVLAATELSGAFCKKALDREKALPRGERNLFGQVDLNRGPRQFTNYLKGRITEQYAQAFWLRAPSATEKEVLSQLIDRLRTNVTDSADETEKLLQVFCVSFGSSLAFLTK